ncbi:hypothetical protein ROLI_030260 [Roseobacter fucihabitans]|uniref:Uncharacterized protein n=1 Tax=Roseobacter fucihabitans TaxID=1537242 RepID=A0ABZ2BX86_9RHOB|nr:hypothetical protein [Roseobacter litoralis]MBC6967898.1 hypothetical protein [Roseobacter litoralis]MBC6968074.1 hypothetical protein [Roseobacter litoralis]
MSKNPQDHAPYHQRYSEPAWYRDQPKFPKGRDPNTDLFKDDAIKSIGEIAGNLDDADFHALQLQLRNVAFDYMTALHTTPLRLLDGLGDVKLTSRIKYLETHTIKPARLLLDALADDNSALLSEWPEKLDYPAPDKSSLVAELNKFHDRATELKLLLEDRLPNESMTMEFLTDLGNALTRVLKSFFPSLTISRGTYHKTVVASDPSMHGSFLSVMAICIGEILPAENELSSKLIGELRKLQGP